MKLEDALLGMESAQARIRTATAISNPTVLSEQMMRLSQYTAVLDSLLAEFEREYDIRFASTLLLKTKNGMKVSPAETMTKMELAETKGQIDYLNRIVGSSWKQVMVIQSRVNHLKRESQTNI